ncbi:MAG: hypothetical protein AVDCRST_MAG86-360 [uncultured Truepera sp.]|uniref:Uncharacterized protein n=1 Tax=uncultured Truepera sp. TaxID=543023 RepID=A0A6J4UN08_9DEIN|nr:MAG: hypothetical protein AVDCRST_MAG86-360 [uncultured Truepera sp.]
MCPPSLHLLSFSHEYIFRPGGLPVVSKLTTGEFSGVGDT